MSKHLAPFIIKYLQISSLFQWEYGHPASNFELRLAYYITLKVQPKCVTTRGENFSSMEDHFSSGNQSQIRGVQNHNLCRNSVDKTIQIVSWLRSIW